LEGDFSDREVQSTVIEKYRGITVRIIIHIFISPQGSTRYTDVEMAKITKKVKNHVKHAR